MFDYEYPFRWLGVRLPAGRPLRLLTVGCGACPEGKSLLAAGVELTGVDFDEQAIATARARLPEATFICRDAARFDPGQDSLFDVILLRRPDIAAQPAPWQAILTRIPARLAPGGQVMLTTPGPHEAALAADWLLAAGFARVHKEPLDADDEHFLVTASQPAMGKAMPIPATKPLAVNVVLWNEDDDEAAPVCDLTTGLCSPAPANIV
ncbi:MAG: class I SAM-dependent methyltransferase [Candidatus Promineofilum sp.]|nr:class I SAM-dependent methyltransferase [Promineifilum sp.]MCW5862635.1 class I SAM-dependent methyltransferase [Anaerolineae bacterium]